NHERLSLHVGTYKITRTDPRERYGRTSPADAKRIDATVARADIKLVPRATKGALSTDPGAVCGLCSGGSAINLAYLFGAGRIVLLGHDMRHTGHWHDRTIRTPPDHYAERFIPPLARMAARLRVLGVRVINCTQSSALTCFPLQ